MKSKLKDFLADLITDDRWSATVLGRLLNCPSSRWHSVPVLCAGQHDALELYESLMAGSKSDLMVTWLPHPADGKDACLVFFYNDDDMSSSVAVLNRARHLELLQMPGPPR